MGKLEKVQQRATTILPTLRNLSYEDRVHHLNLPSLSYRQFRGDTLTTFQILNGFVDLDATEFFFFFFLISQPLHIREATHKLLTRHTRNDIRKRYFANTITKKWNSLPSNILE